MNKLITFIVPTRNLSHLAAQFDQFEKSTYDHSRIEFLVKVDSDHAGAEDFLKDQVRLRPFQIRYISTPRIEGTFSLWIAVEQLFGMVDSDSYFVQILSDEPYFITNHWDRVLEKYVGFYPDHVFRLRLSDVKFNNYASNYECAFRCDSFPLYTKRWLELTEGTGDCWGSDAYQQLVSFHLGLGTGGYLNFYRLDSICRDIPVLDLKMGGLEFGVGVSPEMQKERHIRNLREWNRLSSYKMQEHFSYLARRMYCYIWARQQNLSVFYLERDEKKKTVKVISSDRQVYIEKSYELQRLIISCQNIIRNIRTLYWIQLSPKANAIFHNIVRRWKKTKNIPSNTISAAKSFIFKLVSFLTLFFFRGLFVHIRGILKLGMKKMPVMRGVLIFRMFYRPIKNNIHLLFQVYIDLKKMIKSICVVMLSLGDKLREKLSDGGSLPIKVNEFLRFNSPGISVLYSSKYRLCPGIEKPSDADKQQALLIIDELQVGRIKYRNMEFESGEVI